MDSLVLASKSPRRREILNAVHIPFIVCGVDVSEQGADESSPRRAVVELSGRKVDEASSFFTSGLVVGVDTIVVLDGRILGKPADEADALEFLRILSGKTHTVLSGLTVHDVQRSVRYTAYSETAVHFSGLDEDEINRYIDEGEWADKAGGYAIQGRGAFFVKRIEGSHYNVMGLPVEELYKILKRFSYFTSEGEYRPIRKL